MFHHEKQLFHPVGVERPNPQYAALLQEQLGGGNGELKAAMQYLSQSFRIRDGRIKDLFLDIAAEELSLSHILNAEGEKLQYVLGTLPGPGEAATLTEVMQINQSVLDTMSDIMEQQMLLSSKLSAAMTAPVLPGPAGPTGATRPLIYAQQ